MAKPLITIVVPSYNQGTFLNDALESIFSQDLPVEVFVMDAGSSDDSISIIEQWQSEITWWRSSKDQGQSIAINEGVAKGSAPFVCWLNSDDVFLKNGLSILLKSIQHLETSPVVYGKCWTINSSKRKIFPYLTLPFSASILANFCFISQPATLIRRKAWEKVGGVNGNLHMAMDYDLWWRLFNKFGKFKYIRKFISGTRMHTGTKTAIRRKQHYQESMEIVRLHYGYIPSKWYLAWPFMVTLRTLLKK